MNRQISGVFSSMLLGSALAVTALGCGNKDAGSQPSSGAAAAPAGPTPEIAGEYTIKGTNPGGGDYGGSLSIAKRGAVYQFACKSGASSYNGVGVQTDSSVGVAFSSAAAGKGCSVAHYKVGADGGLSGRWGEWGIDNSGTETATRSGGGSGLDGKYDITGSRLDGKAYKGTLTVAAQGPGYLFTWVSGETSEGFGVRMGNFVSVGIGGGDCGFVAYEVKPDGTLNGQWSSFKSKAVGTEIATRTK